MASHKDMYLNRKVGIITTDIYRAGATAGLKSLGNILSIPIFEVKELDDFPRALKNLERYDVILVDTPGRSPLSKGSMPDLQTHLAVLRPDETLLVLSANMALEEQWLFIGLYQGIHPSALVITKLDETSQPGKVLAFADNPDLPLRYVTTGQEVPDSLQIHVGRAILKRLPLTPGKQAN
jgi:flagellar biosynthesis protein FlhF